jgi:pimeloyl-ACP methyl ester carboxylesterase
MIGDLSARWRVIALDLPGFGFSDPPPNGDYSIHRYAGILESFLQVLNIDNATLVCHDWGGPIVLTYALRNPDKYERLVIFDTFLHNDLPPMPLSYRIAKIKPFGELFMWLGGTNFARSGLESGVVDKSLITDEVYHRYYMPDGTTDKLNDTMLGTLRIDYADDVRFIEKNLKTIDKPTLIIWGEDDWYLPPYLGDKIHDDIPGSRMAKTPHLRALCSRRSTRAGHKAYGGVLRGVGAVFEFLRCPEFAVKVDWPWFDSTVTIR